MLYELLRNRLGTNVAPFAAVVLFVVVVGASLWLTPRLARWIDARRGKTKGFFDDMMDGPSEDDGRE